MSADRFKHLTRQEKIELLLLQEEKEKREKLKRPTYVPNEGQLEIHKDAAEFRERFVFSGNGFGKTALLVNELLWAANGYNPILGKYTKVPAKIYVVVDSPNKIDEKIIPEMRLWSYVDDKQLHQRGKPYTAEISFRNGSTITFLGHDFDPMKFEGIDGIDFFAADEPLPRAIYIGMYRGLRAKGSDPKVLVCGTPLGQPWLRTEVFEPWSKGERKGTKCYRFHSSLNAKNLREGSLEELASRLSEKEREVRLGGSFFDLEGLALASLWRSEVHLVDAFEVPKDWPCVVAIDPHYSKKHTACLLTTDKEGGLYYVKEMASHSHADPFSLELLEFMKGYRIIDIVSDSLGSTPGTGGRGNLSFIEVLRENGVRARATTSDDKNDEAFIEKIKQVLFVPEKADNFGRKLPKLRIFKECTGIIGDILNVEWVKYRNLDEYKPKLNISNKDFLSTLKYALATSITFLPGRPKTIRPSKPSPWGGQKRGFRISGNFKGR